MFTWKSDKDKQRASGRDEKLFYGVGGFFIGALAVVLLFVTFAGEDTLLFSSSRLALKLCPSPPPCPDCPECVKAVPCPSCPACAEAKPCPACPEPTACAEPSPCPAAPACAEPSPCPACPAPPACPPQQQLGGAALRLASLPPAYDSCKSTIKPWGGYKRESLTANPNASIVTSAMDLKTFYCAGREQGTVKTVEHVYEYVYTKYLSQIRDQPLRLLAVGLGCNMAYGPGHSFELWKRYLPNASISYIEFDARCAEPFKAKLEATGGRLYVGSQSSKELAAKILEDTKTLGQFDVVSDDGAIIPDVTQETLVNLWPALKPGGLWVAEDVWRHFDTEFQDRNDTFLPKLVETLYLLHCRTVWRTGFGKFSDKWNKACENFLAANTYQREVLSVECFWEGCALVKAPVLPTSTAVTEVPPSPQALEPGAETKPAAAAPEASNATAAEGHSAEGAGPAPAEGAGPAPAEGTSPATAEDTTLAAVEGANATSPAAEGAGQAAANGTVAAKEATTATVGGVSPSTTEGASSKTAEGATPSPAAEGATSAPAAEGATPAPAAEGFTPSPAAEGATPATTTEATPAAAEGATPATTEGATPAAATEATPAAAEGATPATTEGTTPTAAEGATPETTEGATPAAA